jgi:hypothetical protein
MSIKTIPEHWDTEGFITADSNAWTEYDIWADFTALNPHLWKGDEFTMKDFQDHIDNLNYELHDHQSNRKAA